jgi:alkylglycerol monooxygenase
MNPIYILFAFPVFLLLMGFEMLMGYLKHQQYYRFNDTVINLLIGIGNQAFNLVFKAMTIGIFVWLQEQWHLVDIPLTWWSVVLCLFLFDFLFYWAHRWGHEVNLFWGAHLVHHSSEEYNLSVALRQSWFHNVLAFFIFLPIPLLGFPKEVFISAAGIDVLYQFWIHTKAIGKLPRWVEAFFNTPSHHRVHHGRNPKYIDKNHAGMFIIWDRMFGTFQAEEEEVIYGLTTPLKSWNPTWANMHYYVEMFALGKQFKSWKDKLKLIFARPGWKPKELGGYTPTPSLAKQDLKKYDARTTPAFSAYVAAQLALVLVGLVELMVHFKDLAWYFQIGFLAVLVVSGMICGAILENKRWVLVAEYVRLALVIVMLNTLYYTQYFDWFLYMVIGSGIGFVVFNLWFTLGWVFQRRANSSPQEANA